jgi:uncharacterized protein (TIGR02466 family)
MNKLNIISIPFFEFTADEQLTDDVLEDVKKLDFDNPSGRDQPMSYGDEFYYHSKLFDFFDKCLLEVKNNLQILPTLDLPIITCWANKASKGQFLHYHQHPNSVVSGIFYLTTHESGNTVFVSPDPWYKNINRDGLFYCNNNTGSAFGETLPQLSGKSKPVKGKLILYPSHIKHKVLPLIENETRYSIAFNTFFSGVIGDTERTVYLDLKAKSVREFKEQQ